MESVAKLSAKPPHPSPAQLLKAPVPPLPICQNNYMCWIDRPNLEVKLYIRDITSGVDGLRYHMLLQLSEQELEEIGM